MTSMILRRVATLAGGVAVAAGLTVGFTSPAMAAPGDLKPLADRVIRPFNTQNLLQPTGTASGARIVSKPRIGQAAETPESQVWTFDFPKIVGADGKVVRGTRAFVFQPSLKQGRPLCIDVVGDSQQQGAALELRPCDGTPSQAWVQVGDVRVPFLQNVGSGLNMEVVDGTVVQNAFVRRPAKETPEQNRARTQRTNAQLFQPAPKVFGFGGA